MLIVGLGPGEAEAVPAAALDALRHHPVVFAPPLAEELRRAIGVPVEPLPPLADLPDHAVLAAPDPEAHRLARALPSASTRPARESLRARAIGAQVAALCAVGAHLRRECPWDREQTVASIVPHTIEEAFEVAEAVASEDPGRQADEVGDLLFQAVFLAQLLEDDGVADLGTIARAHGDKLVRRHPHVYGDAVAAKAGEVRELWERQKREQRDQGIFHDLPAGLPALAYATKAQRRAAAVGFEFPSHPAALGKLDEELEELRRNPSADELGDVLFACVAVARALGVDPELALRAAAGRFRARVEEAASLAEADGESFESLSGPQQLEWYRRAKTATP